jgi:hypothetical protein
MFPVAMPLSSDPVSRIRTPTRGVCFEAHARAGGLRDVEPILPTGGEAARLYYDKLPRWQRDVETGSD